MRRSLAAGWRAASMVRCLNPHLAAPMLVHGTDGGLGDERLASARLYFRGQLDQMLAIADALHAVLHELDCLVVLEPEEARRPHQIALPQPMPRHRLVVALEAEHGPLHDELVRPVGHDLAD